jgi:hypothetical protein
VAGSARAVLGYLREAHRLRWSTALRGTTGGDQIAMNLHCHTTNGPWREVPERWNYCLNQRNRSLYSVRADGTIAASDGSPVHVVHGNGKSLTYLELSIME